MTAILEAAACRLSLFSWVWLHAARYAAKAVFCGWERGTEMGFGSIYGEFGRLVVPLIFVDVSSEAVLQLWVSSPVYMS